MIKKRGVGGQIAVGAIQVRSSDVACGAARLYHILIVQQGTKRQELAVFLSIFFQIFALRAKIWKNISLRTLLPQANMADEYATA